MKRAVMIGAGQIGRGFIGMLLEQAGYHVVFADLNMEVIDDINTRHEYTVHLVDTQCVNTRVSNISAMSSLDPRLIGEYEQCQLVCTAVGLTSLPKIAGPIARGIAARRAAGSTEYMNVIACENAVRGSSQLKALVEQQLSPEDLAYARQYVGFPDCAVDRIIPPAHGIEAAEVVVEKYHEWDVEKKDFRGPLPEIAGMELVDDLTAYLERKLFTLNGANVVTGAIAYLKGYRTVNEALKDEEIYSLVLGLMEECSAMLEKRHGFSPKSMADYRASLMQRFMNPYIIDEAVRVVREPIRKLSATDRLVAPMNYAHSYGIATPHYYRGIASVLLYDNPEDEQSIQMQALIRSLGLRPALEQISGVPAESAVAVSIEQEYEKLKEALGK
ncbi:MAG: mannitol-1-phosphate 5-dehydrogenase [Candidatus Limivicinus sp.]|nr:mannitol-1-phosphate 5-dehydrogenase [Candidatus Limivicinus sp.]